MASKLNDPNFGSRDIDPSAPQSQSKLNDPSFGSKKPSADPYGQTRETVGSAAERREQRSFERQFRREAKYGRVSQETKAKIVGEAINNFVNQVISQKQSSLSSNNTSSVNSAANVVPTVVNTPPPNIDLPSFGGGKGGGAPLGSTVEIDICLDGAPATLRVYGEIIEEEEQ